MDFIRYFINNKRIISFGFLLTFFSSFGQTFLLSLYVPKILNNFHLSNSSFGGLYAAATIGSSILLVYVGKLIDNTDLKKYTLATAFLLMAASLTLAFSVHIIMVFLALLGLRFAGQGLMSHISKTTISKHFHEGRGKALSIISLGYSSGEGVLPAIVSLLIAHIGWRYSLIANSSIMILVLVPLIFYLISNYSPTEHIEDDSVASKTDSESFSRLFLIKDKRFYLLVANTVVIPFLLTGLFFFQTSLADYKSWDIEWLSFCFMGYAIGRTVFSLVSGHLIDKYSAIKLLPLYLLPFVSGLLLLLTVEHRFAGLFYLFFTGMSVGLGSIIKTASIVEIYGKQNLGGIRSVFSTLKVLGTALSPLLFGFMMDQGFDFFYIIILAIAILGSISLLNIQFLTSFKLALSAD